MAHRFEMRKVATGWAVFEKGTGEVARVNDVPLTGLSLDDADDLVDLLNRLERQRPARVS